MSDLTTLLRDSYSLTAFDGFDTTGDFDPGTASALAWMSQLAYETADRRKVSTILERWQMQLPADGIIFGAARSVLPIASTYGVVAAGRGATILSFAGTDPISLANWISDFNFRPTPDGTADGFDQAFEAVRDQVPALMGARPAPAGPLFVTGHSLGGALAVVAAHALQTSGVDVAAIYTFGMPRPGASAFAGKYDALLGQRTYRMVHGEDIVPTVAPSTFGLRHVARLLRCGHNARFDPATLATALGGDDPLFSGAAVQQLRDLLHDPVAGLAGAAQRLTRVAEIAALRRPMHGRPPSIAVMVEALPPAIRDHLPDCYINALGAGPL